jgi:flagellar protein FliS
MLYDGAIRRLEQSLHGFTLDDPGESVSSIHNNLQRAQDIIRELNYALDLSNGGELALQLRRLYDYFDRLLDESNRSKEAAGIHEVIGRLTTLRDAWAEMLRNQEGGVEVEAQPTTVAIA